MTHKVRLVPGGREFGVETGESILDAALRQGVALPYGCRSGSCGTCACRVLSGSVDYPECPPLGLSDQEIADGFVLACRAHPREDLVVDAQELTGLADVVIKTLQIGRAH